MLEANVIIKMEYFGCCLPLTSLPCGTLPSLQTGRLVISEPLLDPVLTVGMCGRVVVMVIPVLFFT